MTDTHIPFITCLVQDHHHGLRLDQFLVQACPDLTRSRLAQLIKGGHVEGTDDIRVTAPSLRVQAGQTFILRLPPPDDPKPQPQAMNLAIVFEDADLLVINKPAGLVVHPGAGNPDHTLVNALIAHCGHELSGIGGVRRPGIIHRLDKETSGLMVVAKHDQAHHNLSQQLSTRHMQRIYHAFVWGVLSPCEGHIEAPIARHPTHRQKMAVRHHGKPALTHYRTLACYGENVLHPIASRVECKLDTGRTHQIRVHLSHRKHPVMGDPVYGLAIAKRKQGALGQAIDAWESLHHRQALHACALSFAHPSTHEACHFSAELPEDLQALESTLSPYLTDA